MPRCLLEGNQRVLSLKLKEGSVGGEWTPMKITRLCQGMLTVSSFIGWTRAECVAYITLIVVTIF